MAPSICGLNQYLQYESALTPLNAAQQEFLEIQGNTVVALIPIDSILLNKPPVSVANSWILQFNMLARMSLEFLIGSFSALNSRVRRRAAEKKVNWSAFPDKEDHYKLLISVMMNWIVHDVFEDGTVSSKSVLSFLNTKDVNRLYTLAEGEIMKDAACSGQTKKYG
jgi:hypothetical protein